MEKKTLGANRDVYCRLSFLFQAANTVGSEPLSRAYNRAMDGVAKKNVLKLSPAIKRSLCKKCNRSLNPGSREIENLSKDQRKECDVLVIKCCCGQVKRFPVGKNRDYKLFSEAEDIEKIV